MSNLPLRTTRQIDRQPNGRFPSGWYIIDHVSILRESGDYLYLKELEPYTHVGYGFRVYEITPEIAAMLEAIDNN